MMRVRPGRANRRISVHCQRVRIRTATIGYRGVDQLLPDELNAATL